MYQDNRSIWINIDEDRQIGQIWIDIHRGIYRQINREIKVDKRRYAQLNVDNSRYKQIKQIREEQIRTDKNSSDQIREDNNLE